MSSTIDLSFLENFTGNDYQQMSKYINLFLGDTPRLMEKMRKSLKDENWSGLKTAAHSLKPLFIYMGIKNETILTIEECAENERNLEQLSSLVLLAEETLQQACSDLKLFLKQKDCT